MVTPNQAAILSFLAACPNKTAPLDDLLARFGEDSFLLIDSMSSSGLVQRRVAGDSPVTLIPRGFAALDEYNSALQKEIEDRAREERREKEQAAKNNKATKQQLRHDLLVASVGAAVGSAVTGVIDHFTELRVLVEKLVNQILALFH